MPTFLKFLTTSPRTRSLIASNCEGITGVTLIAVFSHLGVMGTSPAWVLQLGVVGLTIFSSPDLLQWVKRRHPGSFAMNVMLIIDLTFLLLVGYMSSWGPWGLIAVALYTPKFFDAAGPQVWKTAFLFMIPGGILGQVAIHQHWVASVLDQPLADRAAIMMALICLQCLHRVGTNNEALLRAEAALRRNEERYRALVHNSSDIVTIADEHRTLSFVSPAVESAGFAVESLVGTPIDARIHRDDLDVFRSTFDAALSSPVDETTFQCQARFELPDGNLHWFEIVISDLRHVPAVDGVVLNARDITERRILEAQLLNAQKLESVGRLAAGVAHEINTPVQFVMDNLTFLQEAFDAVCQTDPPLQHAQTDEQVSFYLEEIPLALRQSADGMARVATIVGAMKTFSHPSQEASVCDVNEAIRNTVAVAHGEAQGVAAIELDLGNLPPLLCSLSDLNQVVLNLVVNATHAIADSERATDGRGIVGVTTFHQDGFVHIGVSDNGTGIAPDVQGHVFDAFFTTKPVGTGTGQGLNHVYSIVAGYGGTVTFETTPGSGTTFWVRLPTEMSRPEQVGAGAAH